MFFFFGFFWFFWSSADFFISLGVSENWFFLFFLILCRLLYFPRSLRKLVFLVFFWFFFWSSADFSIFVESIRKLFLVFFDPLQAFHVP